MSRAIAVCRVSRKNKQQDTGVQLYLLKEYAKKKGIEIVKAYELKASAWRDDKFRPILQNVLEEVTQSADLLLITRINRLMRNEEIRVDVVERWLKQNPTKYVEFSDTGAIWSHNTNPSYKMSFRFQGVVATNQSEEQSRVIREGKSRMQLVNGKKLGKHGKFDGRQPFMCKNLTTGEYNRYINPKKIERLRDKDYTINAIAEELKCSRGFIIKSLKRISKEKRAVKIKQLSNVEIQPIEQKPIEQSQPIIIGI